MSLLLALASAAVPASGSNLGGAFVGAHAGVIYNNLKFEKKDQAITKAEAEAVYGVINNQLSANGSYTVAAGAANFAAATQGVDAAGTTLTIKIGGTLADGAAVVKAVLDAKDSILSGLSVEAVKKITTVRVLTENASTTAANAAALANAAQTELAKEETKKAFVAKLFNASNELKYTGTTGLVGLHAGYLHKINACFGLGALVEGTWSFSQDLKIDSIKEKDFTPRFGANVLARAAYFMTHNAFIGADLGVAVQEFRFKKLNATTPATGSSSSTDKDSKWLWAPMARAVVGFAMTDNLAVTVTAGGSLPMKKQDVKDFGGVSGERKVKYYNVQGNVGVSYYFGA